MYFTVKKAMPRPSKMIHLLLITHYNKKTTFTTKFFLHYEWFRFPLTSHGFRS